MNEGKSNQFEKKTFTRVKFDLKANKNNPVQMVQRNSQI
jgi:hypothetical protein